ncbi:MAG TPA: tRNA (guanosine(37)-N1)-methyltransferase TrmD [Geobacteraceae bacterium]|nr:tRNA (guanosine(37)-N1)-methyltransferase TrmD [Geobacteraceae bacterium]
MKFHILTLFPEMFAGPLSASIIGRGVGSGLLGIELYNIRDYAVDRHRTVDDAPYGGGAGMVMKVEPLTACLEAATRNAPGAKVLLASPRGIPLTQSMAAELAVEKNLIVVCGRYEGIDERVRELFSAVEFSIGDYVLTGGELAAMVLVDAVGRLVPGVLGCSESAEDESFSAGLLEYPQYTRPPEFRGLKVPDVLLSGNHKEISRWRRRQALLKTIHIRPSMLENADLTVDDRRMLQELERSSGR